MTKEPTKENTRVGAVIPIAKGVTARPENVSIAGHENPIAIEPRGQATIRNVTITGDNRAAARNQKLLQRGVGLAESNLIPNRQT
jgi:hypothetical protein